MKQFLYLVIFLLFYHTVTQAQYQEGLDPYFGNKGIVLTSGIKSSYFGGIALRGATLQPDGKIIAIAAQRVSRYKDNGDLDSTFGIDGVFEQSIYDDDGNLLHQAFFNAVAMQPDGKIVVTGYGDLIGGPILLFRLTSNGFLDMSFGKNGVVCNNTLGSNGAYDLTLQPDSKIIVLATQHITDSQVLARYHSNGQIDSSFGIYGKAVNRIKGIKGLGGGDVILLTDGRIVALGDGFGVSRYLPNGTLDTTFNHTGIVLGFSGSSAPFSRAMAIRPDGKIWIAGYPLFDNPTPFLLARLKENGSLDSSFGSTGFRQYDWDTGDENKCRELLLLPDGKVVLGGRVTNKATGVDNFGLIRIHSDGREDSSFGNNGRLLTQVRGSIDEGDELYKIILQPDNKILALGNSLNPSDPNGYAAIVRYYANGKTGIVETNKKGNVAFSVYPNPAQTTFYITNNTSDKISSICISNMLGVLVKQISKPEENKIDVSELPNACYIITVITDKTIRYNQTIMINH